MFFFHPFPKIYFKEQNLRFCSLKCIFGKGWKKKKKKKQTNKKKKPYKPVSDIFSLKFPLIYSADERLKMPFLIHSSLSESTAVILFLYQTTRKKNDYSKTVKKRNLFFLGGGGGGEVAETSWKKKKILVISIFSIFNDILKRHFL